MALELSLCSKMVGFLVAYFDRNVHDGSEIHQRVVKDALWNRDATILGPAEDVLV